MSSARNIVRQLATLDARVERRGERVMLCAGKHPVPAELIEAARQVKAELSQALIALEDAQQREVDHLRRAEAKNPRISPALIEDAQVSAFDERLRAETSKMLIKYAHVSTFDKPKDFCGSQPASTSKALNSPSLSPFDANEHLRREWAEAEEERAAIVEHDGRIPLAWAEGFARLDPDRPPGDVPLRRWERFVDDVGWFLDSPFCAVAAALGWRPLDLFGCDRDRPFARIDQVGLLWLFAGDKLIALTENTATIERRTGARQTYRRKSVEPGRVLAWELPPWSASPRTSSSGAAPKS